MNPRDNRRIFIFLGCYFLLHLLFKVLLADGVELDEAEQFLWAQDFRLGYGAELPLYTWLQASLFVLVGTNIFAVALLKNLLLFATCIFTYLGAREAAGNERCASAAMLTLFFIPQIVFESQRVLTHMVLATALAALALYFFLRLANSRELRYYLLFGFTAGLGMLAKYNFGIFLLALLLSALSIPSLRPCLADRKSWAALAVCLIVIAVPFSWMALHPALAMAKSYKLHAAGGGGVPAGHLRGMVNLAGSAAAFASVPLLLYGLIFFRAPQVLPADTRSREYARLTGRTILIALTICLLLVFFFRVTQFRVRWMQPLLLPLPVFLSLMVREKLSDRAFSAVRLIAACAAVAVLLLLNGRILCASYFKPTSQNEPYSSLAAQIAGKGFTRGVIVAEGRYLAGNLRPHFPSARIIAPDTPLVEPLTTPFSMPVLVVWDAEGKPAMPGELETFLLKSFGPLARPTSPSYAEAPYRLAAGHTMRLGFVILTP